MGVCWGGEQAKFCTTPPPPPFSDLQTPNNEMRKREEETGPGWNPDIVLDLKSKERRMEKVLDFPPPCCFFSPFFFWEPQCTNGK